MRSKPRLKWRPAALADLIEIVTFIAEDNPDAAQKLKDEIEGKAAELPNHPKLYKTSQRVRGMRELVIGKYYLVLYRETPTLVEVARVLHTRRQLSPLK